MEIVWAKEVDAIIRLRESVSSLAYQVTSYNPDKEIIPQLLLKLRYDKPKFYYRQRLVTALNKFENRVGICWSDINQYGGVGEDTREDIEQKVSEVKLSYDEVIQEIEEILKINGKGRR